MSCRTGKIEHQTVTAAQAHADSILRKDGHQPNVYICAECGFFHVGGGRASDRPAYRPVPVVTTPKPTFVQKKIDKGKRVAVETIIVEKLRTTLLTNKEIANIVGVNYNVVQNLRLSHGIPNSHERKNKAIADLLAVNPRRNRREIAQTLKIRPSRVFYVAKKLGLEGQGERVRGVKHRFFGTKQSKLQKQVWARPELRKKLSKAVKEKQWTPSEKSDARRCWLRRYNQSPEVREQRRNAAKRYWASPEGLRRKEMGQLRKNEIPATL